jgi:hypothetical protein
MAMTSMTGHPTPPATVLILQPWRIAIQVAKGETFLKLKAKAANPQYQKISKTY